MVVGRMKGRRYRTDGWTDGRTDGGWTDGQMDGWTDGQMDGGGRTEDGRRAEGYKIDVGWSEGRGSI